MGGIEEILLGVVIRRRGDDHIVRIGIRRPSIQRRRQVQRLLLQILLDILILDGTLLPVDLLHLLGNDVHGHHLILLRQQRRDGKPYITGTCNCNFHDRFYTKFKLTNYWVIP